MAQSLKLLDQDSRRVPVVFTYREVTAISTAAWPYAARSIRFALGSRLARSQKAWIAVEERND